MNAENTAKKAGIVMGIFAAILSTAIIIHEAKKLYYSQQPATSKLDSCEVIAYEMQQTIDRIDSTVREIKAMLQPIDTVDGTYGSKVDSSLNSCYSTIH
jgi:hypothetical protein